jgi:hypothetical protein
MTIDERLEKLTERHEALAQSMEVFQGLLMDNERRNEKQFAAIAHNFEVALDSIKSLERIAAAHEGRISHLEGD